MTSNGKQGTTDMPQQTVEPGAENDVSLGEIARDLKGVCEKINGWDEIVHGDDDKMNIAYIQKACLSISVFITHLVERCYLRDN